MDSNQTHSCGGQEDNVDLWRKLKVAKNNLITQTEFFNKYRPPLDNSAFSSKNLDRESKLTVGESSLKPEGGPSDQYTSHRSRPGLDSKESTAQMIGKPHSVNKVQTVTEIFQDLAVQNVVEVNAGLQGPSLRNANTPGIPVVEGPQPHPDCGESIVTHAEPNLNFEPTVAITPSGPIGTEGTLFSSRY